MALQTKSVIGFYVFVTNNFVMLGAPVQESFISYWLPLGTLTLVVRTDKFTEVLAVGEVKGNVVGVESLLEVFKFPFKDV